MFQVMAFCDVDEKKIEKGVYIYEESKVRQKTAGMLISKLQLM